MKNKMREKFIASLMILSFTVMGTSPLACAQDDTPFIRSQQPITSIDINSETRIQNGNSPVNLSLRDADVMQVLRMFADQAGMNIIFGQDISGKVTMDLVNVTLQRALSLVISTSKLKYIIQGNTLIITTAGDDSLDVATGSKDIILIPVKYVSAASIADYLNKSIFNKNSISPGASSKPVVTVNPANNELIIMGTHEDALLAQKIIDQFDKKPAITNFKVNHVTPAEMAGLICSTLIPSFMSNGEASKGGAAGGAAGIPTGGAAGVPTGFASDSMSSSGGEGLSIGGGQLLCSVDQQAEAEEMSSLPFKNMTVSYFPTIGMIQVIGGSPTQIEMIRDYIAANDIKSPQAYLEVQLIELTESGSKQFNNTWQYRGHNISINSNGGITTNPYPIFLTGHGYSDVAPAQEATVEKWSTSPQLTWTIYYLIQNSKARSLANPRILVTNGQESVIDLTSDYVAKVTTQYLDSTGSGSSQVQRDYDIQSDNGIKVSVTPFISPDGYVTLDIKPEYSTPSGPPLTTPNPLGGEDIAATLLQRRNLDLKGVRIKDGETLIIGGMIQEEEQKTVNKIPFLGDLPFIGVIFRSTTNKRDKRELVIMITPQILIDTEDAVETTNLDL